MGYISSSSANTSPPASKKPGLGSGGNLPDPIDDEERTDSRHPKCRGMERQNRTRDHREAHARLRGVTF